MSNDRNKLKNKIGLEIRVIIVLLEEHKQLRWNAGGSKKRQKNCINKQPLKKQSTLLKTK